MTDASILLCLKELIIIQRKIVRKNEQIRLIRECRQSGLSDYQYARSKVSIQTPFITGPVNCGKAAILFQNLKANPKALQSYRMKLKCS